MGPISKRLEQLTSFDFLARIATANQIRTYRSAITSMNRPRMTRRSLAVINQSMSGDRGSAGLESDANGVQTNEIGFGGEVQEFHGLR
jgi:hypothetical protein